MKRYVIAHFLGYLAVLALLGVLVRDVGGQPALTSTVHTVMAGVQGLSDPVSFATGGLDVARHGWFVPERSWLSYLWPPGFMLLQGCLIRAAGEQAPLVGLLLLLAVTVHAGWLTLLRLLLLPLAPRWAATLAPLVPFAFPVTRLFLLEPTGLVMGESFAVGCFLASVLLAGLALRSRRLGWALVSGILLALSAYLRSQYEVLVTMATLCAVPAVLWAWWRDRRPQVTPAAKANLRATLLVLGVVLLTANAAMAPWRYHNQRTYGTMEWVHALTARDNLSTEKYLLEHGGFFIVRGGGNLACHFEPESCGSEDSKLMFRAFFRHMGPWLAIKAGLLDDYWFAALQDWAVPVQTDGWGGMLSNVLLLLALMASLPCLWLIRARPEALLLIWSVGSFALAHAGIFTLVHFETRYFYLSKIFGVVMLLWLGALAWQVVRQARTAAAGTTLEPALPRA